MNSGNTRPRGEGGANGRASGEIIDRRMCMAAVLNTGSALQYVPMKYRDWEVCFTAVMNDGAAIEFVPEELRDRSMCVAAAKSGKVAAVFTRGNGKEEWRCTDVFRRSGEKARRERESG